MKKPFDDDDENKVLFFSPSAHSTTLKTKLCSFSVISSQKHTTLLSGQIHFLCKQSYLRPQYVSNEKLLKSLIKMPETTSHGIRGVW